MTEREALKRALEALEDLGMKLFESTGEVLHKETFTAIQEHLAQPEQEPVAWMCADESLINKGYARFSHVCMGEWKIPVYTTPPQRKPLTDEEISDAVREADFDWHYGWTLDDEEPNRFTKFARAIEAAHGIKGKA